MRMVSLFSGMGAFDLGASLAGVAPALAVDCDPYACALYHANFPGVPILLRDVRTLSGADVRTLAGDFDLLHASPPCAPYSTQGRRLGPDDPRDVVCEVVRLAGDLRPRWITVENVPGLAGAMTFDRLVEGLDALGYDVIWRVLDSADYGAPQRRRRLFVVAGPKGAPFVWPRATQRDPASNRPLPPWRSAWSAIGDLLTARLALDHVPGVAEADLRARGRLVAIRNLAKGRGSPLQLPAPAITRSQPLAVVLDPLDAEGLPPRQYAPGDDPFPQARRPGVPRLLRTRARYARRLTARELARVQGIPDTYRLSRVSEHRAAMAIGDAVPVPLARALLTAIVAADGSRSHA